MPTPSPTAAEYITGSFYDFYEIEHKFTIYAVTSDEPTPIELQTDGRGYVIESSPEEESHFALIYTSRCRIGLVAQNSTHFNAIEKITLDDDEYIIKIEKENTQSYIDRVNADSGTVFLSRQQISNRLNEITCGLFSETWRGRILKDFAIEPNKVFPQIIELTATDQINDILERSSEELLRTADGIFPILPIQIPELFTQALKLIKVNGLDPIKMRVKGEWTTENSRTGGYNAGFNYLGTLCLLMPTCLKDGEEEIQIVNTGISIQNIAFEDRESEFESQIITNVVNDKFMTVGKLFKMVLERLGLVFMYSNGYFYLLQRETLRDQNPIVFEYNTETFVSNTTSPNFGTNITAVTDNLRFTPTLGQIEANGQFSYQPKARKISQIVIPSASVQLEEIVKGQGGNINNQSDYFSYYRKRIINGVQEPNITIFEQPILMAANASAETLGESVLQLELNSYFNYEPKNLTGADIFNIDIRTYVCLDIVLRVGSDFYPYNFGTNNFWSLNTRTSFNPRPLTQVSYGIGNTRLGGTRIRRVEVNIAPPPATLTGDLLILVTWKAFADNQFTRQTYNVTTNPPIIDAEDVFDGAAASSRDYGTISGTAKLVKLNEEGEINTFSLGFPENEKNGVNITRGQMMIDNLPSIIKEQRVGSFKPNQTITPTIDGMLELFEVDATWRRRNGGSDQFLYQLWFQETQPQIERNLQTYEGVFRANINLVNNVNYQGKIYRWLNYTYTAKPGTTEGLILEVKDNVKMLTPIGSETPILRQVQDGQIESNERPGQISGSIGNIFKIAVIDSDIETGSVNQISINQLTTPIKKGLELFIVDQIGNLITTIEADNNLDPNFDTQSLDVIQFTNDLLITSGATLMISPAQIFNYLLNQN